MDKNGLVAAIAGVLSVTILCVAMCYGCYNANQAYRQLSSECISSGGSIIPQTNNTIICFHERKYNDR